MVDLVDWMGDLILIWFDFDGINAVLHDIYNDVIGDFDWVICWIGKLVVMGGGYLFNFGLYIVCD